MNREDGGKSQGLRGKENIRLSLRKDEEALQVTCCECGPDHALEGKRSQSKKIVFLLFYVAVIILYRNSLREQGFIWLTVPGYSPSPSGN